MKGWVEITLAGVCRRLEIDYQVSRPDDASSLLTGSRRISFTDFDLVPPKRFFGMVKADNSLEVRFTLCLRKIG